jgi:type II secretory pathway component PulJ
MTTMRTARHGKGTRGMSTMEVLAGAALSLTILGIAMSFFTAQQRALRVQNTFTESQNVTRTFTDLISRELRQASYDPTDADQGGAIANSPGAIPDTADVNWCPGADQGITIATPNSIRFKQDLNGDGDTLDSGEDVYYYLSGNTIQRQDGNGTPVTLVTGVPDVGLSLKYYDNSNPPVELTPTSGALTAGKRDCVAKVLITVQASLPNPNPDSTMPLLSTAQIEVALRNRSQNSF